MVFRDKWQVVIAMMAILFFTNVETKAQCTADYMYTSITCGSIVFTDLSVPGSGYNVVEWNWDFDDGYTSPLQNPIHNFANPGTYDVMLAIASDSAGYICRDTIIQQVITLVGLPTVFFTWNPEPTMLGNPTNFYGTSGNTITSWYWDFGDGNIASTQNATHTYTTAGTFNVELTVTDIDGCINSIIHIITIVDIPELDYHWNFACEGTGVQFYIDSPPTDIPAVTSWYWDFGDGGTSTDMEPLHVYATANTYNVSLTIVDTNAATNTVIKPITVNPLPSAIFSIDSPTCSNNHIQFNDNSTTPTGFITNWYWDFGDGSDTTINYPNNPDVTHIYNSINTFIVTLTITNSDSCTNTTQNSITTLTNPIADFSFEETCYNEPVYFTDLSTSNGGSDITSWEWDFSDPNSGSNNTSSIQNPTHVYTYPDSYTTMLITTNIDGCTDTIQHDIIVDSLPDVDFIIADDSICLGQIAEFFGISNSNIATWYWEFGDGGNSTEQNPSYMYSVVGTYLVSLTVEEAGSDQCSNLVSHYIYVDTPTASFGYENNWLGTSTLFYDLSTSQNSYITQWNWEFGDDSTATIQNPTHEYLALGTYDVTLNIMDFDGCSGTVTNQVEVFPPPVFPDSNAIWNTFGYSFGYQEWTYRYGLIGDTTISYDNDTSYTYSKVYSLYDSTLSTYNSIYTGATRTTDDNKVYLKLTNLPETILYDYSLEIGDTIWFKIGGAAASGDVSFWEQDHYKIVINKDSALLLDNQYHTRWYLQGEYMSDIWIEHVGSVEWFGLLNPIISDITTNGNSFSLACFKQNGIPLYLDNPECDKCFCYLLTTINDQTNNTLDIKIFPNPAKDAINISINDQLQGSYKIQILNSMGQNIYTSSSIISYTNSIDITNWDKGLYVVRIKNNNSLIAISKFIIK